MADEVIMSVAAKAAEARPSKPDARIGPLETASAVTAQV